MATTLMTAALASASSTVAHTISGRSGPLVVIGRTALRSGSLVWRCGSLAEARAWQAARVDRVATLSAPEHPDLHGMRYVATRWGIAQWERLGGGWAWDVTADVVEVD